MRMIKWHIFFLSLLLVHARMVSAQPAVNQVSFFEDDKPVTMVLSTDLKKLISEKKLNQYQPANVTFRFPDSTVISEGIKLSARGEFRRKECYMPSMKFDFKKDTSSQLARLKKLKLVCGCNRGFTNENLILKEYLIYKMYNLLTEMSFRVRLLRIHYQDSKSKIKSYNQFGFFIEDVDEMAKRNKCYEVEGQTFHTERTNRAQMTLVALFQYMIGNTDWAVPNYHNMKLMRPKKDTLALPIAIPYDFDYCGLVNADYAIPQEELGISSVKERVYRGFRRNMDELQITLGIFRQKREAIRDLILGFDLLPQSERKEMTAYLDDFYQQIENKSMVERLFIEDARIR